MVFHIIILILQRRMDIYSLENFAALVFPNPENDPVQAWIR